MWNAKTKIENAINGRLVRVVFVALAAIVPGMIEAKPTFGQIPQGVVVLVTYLDPVMTVTTDSLTGLSQSQTTRTVIVDVKHQDNPQFNFCTGELVLINGKMTITLKTTQSSSGRLHTEIHQVSNGTGLGEGSGAKYSFATAADDTWTSDGPAPSSEQTSTIEQHLVRAGEVVTTAGGDDFFIKSVMHYTMVNGVPTATVSKIEFPCR